MVSLIPKSHRQTVLTAAQRDDQSVFIIGPSGSGKSATAHFIHSHGPRSARQFCTVNTKLPLADQLIQARNGTLFIDESKNLNNEDHASLVQFLKTKSISHPANSNLPMILNTRLIIASTEEDKSFGKKNQIIIKIPSLQERKNEFSIIAETLIDELKSTLQKFHIEGIDKDAFEILSAYDWPGNIRELRNVIHLAVIQCNSNSIKASDLPQFGKEFPEFRQSRNRFEIIFLRELKRIYGNDLNRMSRLSGLTREDLKSKFTEFNLG